MNPLSSTLYRPLERNEIRVILLLPGEWSDPLEATFDCIAIDHLGSEGEAGYEAISYAWGSQDRPRRVKITLASGTKDTEVAITESLYQALIHFRHPHVVRRVWADALCINQADNDERAAQVAIMGKIYSLASRVLVWLGPSETGDILAFAALTQYKDTYPAMREYYHDLDRVHFELVDRAMKQRPYCKCCNEQYTCPAEPALTGIRNLDKLMNEISWFSRLWVVQEVSLAKVAVVYRGFHHMDFQALLGDYVDATQSLDRVLAKVATGRQVHKTQDAVHLSTSMGVNRKWQIEQLESLAWMFYADIGIIEAGPRGRAELLFTGLLGLAAKQCSDPRDRVFAVQHLFGLDARAKYLQPDYTISHLDLYRHLTRYLLVPGSTDPEEELSEDTYEPLLLAIASNGPCKKSDGRPSWVPEWQDMAEQARMLPWRYSSDTDYRPYNQFPVHRTRPICKLSTDMNEILIKGCTFATICDLGPCVFTANDHELDRSLPRAQKSSGLPKSERNAITQLLDWLCSIVDFLEGSALVGDVTHLCELLSCGWVKHKAGPDNVPSRYGYIWGHRASSGSTTLKWKAHILETLDQLVGELDKPLEFAFLVHKRLAVVHGVFGRRAGWIPQKAAVGDQLCYMACSPFPFVLRSCSDNKHELLGDA